MKLKEIKRTALQAWSPAQQHPIYLAAGTSAQQLDATFSTNASLEIFELDLSDPTLAMKSCGSFSSPHRYHKLVWGPHGIEDQSLPSGVLIAGGENGNIILYDASKIIAGDSEVIISQSEKHTGPVRALDVNSFQTNLVASGGNESEIYIWDLNNLSSPMTPGPKTQPLEDISCVAWNRQVQHILASASPSGKASVWDLRKNDLIIKVSDHSNRMHCSGLAWNPEVATQLVLASEDDRMPVIQMWDLRFATSPLKVLESHTRGVLAIAWSEADPELLLSCGKDNRILCWNPNTAEVLYELPTSTQWCFDIQWCPRNPAVLSAAAFDGHISIYSIMGGSNDNAITLQAEQLSSSFGNMDPFGTGKMLPPLQLPQTATSQSTVTPLKKPPKWIRRPVGASFAFGGKLVTLDNIKPAAQQPQQTAAHVVHISQVVTETDFLDRSNQLQVTLTAGNFHEYCQNKTEAAQSEFEKTVWSFLKVNFEEDARGNYLELLGYKKEELALKIASALERNCKSDEADVVEKKSPAEEETEPPATETSDLDEVPFEDEEPAVEETYNTEVTPAPASDAINLKVSQDIDGLITQALLTGDYEAAVNLCLHDNRMADGIILAIAGGPELLAKTQKKYFTKTQSKISKLISAVVMKDWLDILETCDLQNWKEALAAVMTYAKPEEFSSLCGLLGSRLEATEDMALQAQACLCYICAGTVEQLVAYWAKAQDSSSPLALQELVEKVVVLQRAVLRAQGGVSPDMGALLAVKMNQYASLLASQGSLQTAISYLPTNTQQVAVQQLRDRLSRALGQQQHAVTGMQDMRQTLPTAAPVQTYTQPPPQPPQVPAAPPQYYQQGRSTSTVTSWSNQTPTALPSVPHPLVPAADPQVESTAPAFGLQSPVSASVPASAAFMFSQQYQNYPQVQQFMPAAGTPGIYQPLQYSSSLASPLPPPPSSAAAAVYPPQFMHPASSQPAAPPVISGPPQGGQPFSPPPLSSGVSFQHGGPGSPTAYLPPPVARASGIQTEPALFPASQRTGGLNQDSAWSLEGPQNGWNDPPALNRAPKKKKVPENFTPPAPITAPIMAPLGDPQVPAAQTMQTLQLQQQGPDQPVGPATFSPIQQQPLGPPGRNPSMPQGNMEGAPGAPIGDVIKPLQSIPSEKITKKPIPEEHMVLKTTFEGLIQKCLAAASDPQTKRKLDDAHKRLEYLYDKLREQTLSPAIVGGLHSMARSIECRCYTDGLNIHTHIVSSSNFSETSAFMPVLKVVLTQANKLAV
ncbi:protein transport protein Sec31A-like isoform X1 [Sinocyclocheilus anshuiensis]|uniref:protein transport protein Sec31A-like isoform X1 n=1 Tax=Sinocyclocheilus anshuiensis TaxID=1608454 RepID=UPI0007B7B4F8|nr:PREDICTED: protein transport protein Sec31A-like isoform X1 [Sinocyclocheilus anshuiensis]XP_016335004.1 PREDICTED: protein transport protein Sec31A-like isoform X1 [Sinocyclocheilus anshuiensis]